jgi:hypothetical protein
MASRYFDSKAPNPRAAGPGTEPVHAIVADNDAEVRRQDRQQAKEMPQVNHVTPTIEERRKNDRRKRQEHILLDTRLTPRRRSWPGVDEKV